jgi:hypothetical protein
MNKSLSIILLFLFFAVSVSVSGKTPNLTVTTPFLPEVDERLWKFQPILSSLMSS